MTTKGNSLNVTNITGGAAEVLEGAGFQRVSSSGVVNWSANSARVFEDRYSVVCVAVYETWTHLSSRWIDDQEILIELISRHFVRSDAKAWDGYLALFTPSLVPSSDRLAAIQIQRDTRRVRKLFAGGSELKSVDSVRRVLLPLLPIEEQTPLQPRNLLDSLPPILAKHGVDEEAAQLAITAFKEQRSIASEIHSLMMKRSELKT